jgi:hypothetical protein
MIRFLLTGGHRYTLEDVRKSCRNPVVDISHYEDLVRIRRLRRGTYVFTDLDRLSQGELEEASGLYLRLANAGVPVLNNPAKVKLRYPLLRALHQAGLNDFNVYRARELPSTLRFPVFIRKDCGHGFPLSELLATREEVEKTIECAVAGGIPEDNLIIIEYAGEEVRAGQYRKLAAFRVGPSIVPHFSVNDRHWLVKYGRSDMKIDDLYEEEREMLRKNPHAEHLTKVFDVAQIDYGRADFGFYKGRIQVFEINTNPTIPAPEDHISPVRIENMKVAWNNYLEALRKIDSDSNSSVKLQETSLSPEILKVLNHDSQKKARRRTRMERLQSLKWRILRLLHKVQNKFD